MMKKEHSIISFIAFLILLIIVTGVIMFIRIVYFPVNTLDKSIKTAYGVTNKTMTADNAIYNYEWFKQQEEDIIALGKKEARAKEAVIDFKKTYPDVVRWTFSETDEHSRLTSIVLGLGNQLDDAIADYNAKSKMVNREIFKDNLPSNISRAFLAGNKLNK